MAACGPHSTNPSTETLTVYEDAPALKPLDLGSPGNSPGDAYYFSAALHSSPGGPMIGEVFGSKTLIKSAPEANPNAEKRATLLFFTFSGGQDDQYAKYRRFVYAGVYLFEVKPFATGSGPRWRDRQCERRWNRAELAQSGRTHKLCDTR
jgi:hypothetical protein